MEQQLAYSFHLGSDKNKSKLAKKFPKKMYLVLLFYQIMLFKIQNTTHPYKVEWCFVLNEN